MSTVPSFGVHAPLANTLLTEGMRAIRDLLEGRMGLQSCEAALAIAEAMHNLGPDPMLMYRVADDLRQFRADHPDEAASFLPRTLSWLNDMEVSVQPDMSRQHAVRTYRCNERELSYIYRRGSVEPVPLVVMMKKDLSGIYGGAIVGDDLSPQDMLDPSILESAFIVKFVALRRHYPDDAIGRAGVLVGDTITFNRMWFSNPNHGGVSVANGPLSSG